MSKCTKSPSRPRQAQSPFPHSRPSPHLIFFAITLEATEAAGARARAAAVGNDDGVAGDRDGRQDLIVLLNVHEGASRGVEGGAASQAGSIAEGDGTEVGKGDQGVILLELDAIRD